MPILTNRKIRVLSRQKGRDCLDDVTLLLQPGLRLHGVRVLYAGGELLIAELPYRQWRDEDGQDRRDAIFSFTSQAAEDEWGAALRAALDEYRAGEQRIKLAGGRPMTL